jgi:CubicO group peptidase (beta-lactamase class C family)
MNRRRFLGVLAGTGGAVAGGAALFDRAYPAAASGPSPPSTSSHADASQPPNEVSYLPIPPIRVHQAVAGLDGLARQTLERSTVPGMAVAVVHDGRVLYAKGFGVREIGTNRRVTADTVFQLASISKTVSSTVVAGAVGEKAVAWDDPVVKYLPGFALADPYVTQNVTIADMFSHRSGLPDHAGDLLEDIGFGQDQVIEALRDYPLDPFRATYAYTNFGLTAAALAVATAKGVAWPELCQQTLYGPLQMTSTSSRYSHYLASPNHAVLHVQINGKWQAKYTRDPDAQSPAAGVSSSVRDMAKWLRLQLASGTFNGSQVVGSEALLETHVPHITSAPAASATARSGFYGLGCNVSYDGAGRVRLSHSGAFNSGAATEFVLLPSEKLGIITLTNGWPIGVPESLNASFMDLVLVGKVTRDWLTAYQSLVRPQLEDPSVLAGKKPPSNPAPALPEAAYVGTYNSALYGTAEVSAGAGGLVLSLGPEPERFPLTHWDANVFSYLPTGENAIGVGPWISAVTFTMGPSGRATTVNIEQLNGQPPTSPTLGTFTRT